MEEYVNYVLFKGIPQRVRVQPWSGYTRAVEAAPHRWYTGTLAMTRHLTQIRAWYGKGKHMSKSIRHTRTRPDTKPGAPAPLGRAHVVMLAVALGVIALALYAPALANGYIQGYDDSQYITENPAVLNGLGFAGLRYAATAICAANWHPLTMLSHMLDTLAFRRRRMGPAPDQRCIARRQRDCVVPAAAYQQRRGVEKRRRRGPVCGPSRLTSKPWPNSPSGKTCSVPLFWLGAMLAYVRYCRQPTRNRYVAVAVLFACGLLAKPMLVTLPVALALFDYWPLKRIEGMECAAPVRTELRSAAGKLIEKWPLLAISALSAAITVLTQWQSEAVAKTSDFSLALRVENALVAYASYLCHLAWPVHLSPFYPYPKAYATGVFALSALALLALTIGAIAYRRSAPYLLVGWLWFLITLTPVIGLIQVGVQSMADRYTYVPYIGLYIAIVWGAEALSNRWTVLRVALIPAALLVVIVFASLTWIQIGYWKDELTLWRYALSVTTENERAESRYAVALAERGDVDGALPHLREALRITPDAGQYYNLGKALAIKNQNDEAESCLRSATRLLPHYEDACYELALLLIRTGRCDEAESYLAQIKSEKSGVQAILRWPVSRCQMFRPGTGALRERVAARPAKCRRPLRHGPRPGSRRGPRRGLCRVPAGPSPPANP